MIRKNTKMENIDLNSVLLERYRKSKFEFKAFQGEEFFYSPICKHGILNKEKISFHPKMGCKILPKMSFLRILSSTDSFPKAYLDKDYLVNPIYGLEGYWLLPFKNFLIEDAGIFGFEESVYLKRLIQLSPYFEKLQTFDDLKFYQAVYMIQRIDLPFLKKVTGCFSQRVLDQLNSIGIFLTSQIHH